MFPFAIRGWVCSCESFLSIFGCRYFSSVACRYLCFQVFRNKRVFERAFFLRLIRVDMKSFDSLWWWRISREIFLSIGLIIMMLFFRFGNIICLNMFFDHLEHVCGKFKEFFPSILFGVYSDGRGMIGETRHLEGSNCGCRISIAWEAFSIQSDYTVTRVSLFIRRGLLGAKEGDILFIDFVLNEEMIHEWTKVIKEALQIKLFMNFMF